MALMRLSDVRSAYYEYSGKASDVNRQLAFAAIAIVWLFQQPDGAGHVMVPTDLVVPAALVVLSLACDFLHYVFSAFLWGAFARLKERSTQVRENLDHGFDAPRWINWPGFTFFVLKILSTSAAYAFLLRFLLATIAAT